MDQIAIITGGNQGIGAAIALELSAKGIHVILVARAIDKLEEVAHKIRQQGGICSYYSCDVTSPAEISVTLEAIEDLVSKSQIILVNNAGIGGPFHRTDEVSEAEWDLIFDTNVKASFLFCRQLLPKMKANNFGRVINISSIYGLVGGANSSTYAASKHALIGYTKSLAIEWAPWNITCNIVSPGYIDTKMGASSAASGENNIIAQIPANRQGTPAEIAKLVSFLTNPESAYINGANLVIDGGMLAGFHLE